MKSIIIAVFLILTLNIQAQTYSFSISSADYTDLIGSTSLNDGLTWDDPQFEIPFDINFQFFGKTINQLIITDTGLGGFLTTNTSETIVPLLIPYGADIIDRGYDFNVDEVTTGSLSNISYVLEGEQGSRILKIEWQNVGFYSELEDDNVSSDFTNFQLWLYEGSDDIEIHFGPNSITQPNMAFDGETGSFVALFSEYDMDNESILNLAYVLEGNPSSPILKELTSVDSFSYLNGIIPNGTIYKFSSNTSGFSEVKNSENLLMYPNPANDNFSISQEIEHFEIEEILILDATGKLVTTAKQENNFINISNLINGIYSVQIKTDKGVINKTLIKK